MDKLIGTIRMAEREEFLCGKEPLGGLDAHP